jgi:hypothetical protein
MVMEIANATLVIQQPSLTGAYMAAIIGLLGVIIGLLGNVTIEYIKDRIIKRKNKIGAYSKILELIMELRYNYYRSTLYYILAKENDCQANLKKSSDELDQAKMAELIKRSTDQKAKSIEYLDEAAKTQRLLYGKLGIFIVSYPKDLRLVRLIKSLDLIENNILQIHTSINEEVEKCTSVKSDAEARKLRDEIIKKYNPKVVSEVETPTNKLIDYLKKFI